MEPINISNLITGYAGRKEKVIISKDITARLSEGSFTCLLGPNGAGKSTLFRTLVGFLPALGGSIEICGRSLHSLSEQEVSRLVSVVLTDRPTVTSMTVSQLVALGRSPYTGFWGRLSDRDRRSVDRAMDMVGCISLSSRLVDTLSDGERQRVMIAKAIAQDTPVIFLDEPTAFLDFPSKVEMMRILKRLASEDGKTILLSSHDVNMSLQLADNIWLLDKKFGFNNGSPRMLADEGLLSRYFERPGISFDSSSISFHIC